MGCGWIVKEYCDKQDERMDGRGEAGPRPDTLEIKVIEK